MKRRLLALLLCATLALTFAPQAAWATVETVDATHTKNLESDPVAEDAATPSGLETPLLAEDPAFLMGMAEGAYSYVDENGDTKTTEALTVTPITSTSSILTSGWYVVNENVTISSTITVDGDVTLILVDGFTLSVTGSGSKAGIGVSNGNSLTIYGQTAGTGTLIAQGGQYGAGIGGTYWELGGTIIILGGTIQATGGQYGAGIGGGHNTNAGTTTISGGTVTATGGQDSAGIGGGYDNVYNKEYGSGGTIIITGGNITANGNGFGAGIGGGRLGQSGNISISGGIINATSGDVSVAAGAAGIGGGDERGVNKITISGGTVVAKALDYGAGIGGGSGGGGGIIEISGGHVTATSRYRGAGIGGGVLASGGTTTIRGGIIFATSEYGGAGIGGGDMGNGGNINIFGGDVTATGGIWGAGIGGGGATLYSGEPRGSGGNITISGGTVKAYGGDFGAGIGAGGTNTANTHNGGTIKITGGKVFAKGNREGALDIGRGRNGVNGTVSINGAALVEIANKGIDASVTTFGTCVLRGSAAGSLLGAYLDGTKIDGPFIDLSSPMLASGTGYTVSGNSVTLTGIENAFYILSGSTTTRNVAVSPGVSADVVLFAADIAPTSGCAFDMTGATVNMTLIGANTLSNANSHAGLQVPAGAALQVVGSGSLTAQGGMNGAGIGGQNGVSAGSIAIYSGNVEALGNGGGAGIGGGNGGNGGTVLLDGTNAVVSATGGDTGYDVGSGNGSAAGGTLNADNGAALLLNRNGTNADSSYITCTLGGEGVGLKAGDYVNSYKLLTYGDVDISPASGVQALDAVTLRVEVEGLSDVDPEGYVFFLSNGMEIGQANIIRTGMGSLEGAAEFLWTAFGGTHDITANYAQNVSGDSYITTQSAQIASAYPVSRITQAPLAIVDPGTLAYGEAPFELSFSGGSGTGEVSFTLKSGDAVSVTATGQVTIIKAGTATIAATKAADSNYEEAQAEIDITVNKATPPSLVFPSSSDITYGSRLSASLLLGGSGDGTFNWKSPDTVPTVNNSGYPVIFTPRDADNYEYTEFTLEGIVGISVSKAVPTVTFPIAGAIVYGEPLSSSILSSGSGAGTFAWKTPAVIPPVENEGFSVLFTPADKDNYETVERIVSLDVSKADQAELSISGIPSAIRYADALFTLQVRGGSGIGELNYAVTSGDSIAVDTVGKVSILRPGAATVTITKAADSNYYQSQEVISINVGKALQEALVISGIPEHMTYGDKDFAISVSGGSGKGTMRYVVTGDAIRVDASGQVHIVRPGIAILTAIKDGDELYEAVVLSLGIQVRSKPSKAPSPTPIPTVSPAITLQPTQPPKAPAAPSSDAVFNQQTPMPVISVTPIPAIPSDGVSPTPQDNAPEETSTEVPTESILTPAKIEEVASTGRIIIQINVADLPKEADAIQLANGERIAIDRTQDTIRVEIGPDELNAQGAIELFALKGESPISLLKVSVPGQMLSGVVTASRLPALAWVAVGIAAAGLAGAVGIIALRKHKQR